MRTNDPRAELADMPRERLEVLAAFIYSQAHITDGKKPGVGPGEVRLNHEEALLCSLALDAEIARRDADEGC